MMIHHLHLHHENVLTENRPLACALPRRANREKQRFIIIITQHIIIVITQISRFSTISPTLPFLDGLDIVNESLGQWVSFSKVTKFNKLNFSSSDSVSSKDKAQVRSGVEAFKF